MQYSDLEEYLDWVKKKSELKFNTNATKNFRIINNCIYWAFLGCNIGSEEDKHRPVLVTRVHKNSTVAAIIPITSKRLNDIKAINIQIEREYMLIK